MRKCTECNKVLRPVVAIDIDGTLGDFHLHFIRFMHTYMGLDARYVQHGVYDGSAEMHIWAAAQYGIDYRTWQDIKLAYRQGAQKRSMPVFHGAEALMGRLSDAGAEIWMTTTRPYMRLDNIDPDTRFWLAHNKLPYEHMLYDDHKYAHLYNRVGDRVVGVLDDLTDQLYEAHQLWGSDIPIQRMTDWNRNMDQGPWLRVTDLVEAADWLCARVTRYYREGMVSV